jgi:hypothetical protein
MNLDELKQTWQHYDQKLAAVNQINDKLIKSMIRARSGSTLAKISRDSLLTMALMAAVSGFCALAIAYNAFDYQYTLQYLPLAFMGLASGIFFILLCKEFSLGQTELHKDNLTEALRKVLVEHEKFMVSHRRLAVIILSAGMLWPVGNLTRMIETKGLFPALGLLLGILAVQVVLVLLARKAGAFKDRRELEEFESNP